MSTVLGSPRRPLSQTNAPANAEPTPFEVFIAIGNILTWLLAVYVIYLHVQARWDLEARHRAQVEAERRAWSEADRQWRDPDPEQIRGQKRKLQQIQEEVDGDQGWEDEMLDWHGEIEERAAREVEVDSDSEIEERMEVMEIPSRQEFERDYGQLWRW
ncbi:uncharacterized protein PV07_01307 [Cladophialophora immunda]|uniref:Uncharacterized protein n=1 Tax=Cladophialophora immunda TaxID=569365 RepID=A0A0D2A2M7_9EURO|nr:uncharacterized protein PV07_01307 [Cladophialophora immunda]KIW34531.1 hypothetical protein PV07_01307 [Cladophialophora immunda]OQV05596.1 hypothetical protein CLAIMM_10314 [Cladophialophora immunda]